MAEITRLERHESWTRGGSVLSHMDDDQVEMLVERSTVAIADPAPLGLWALATGTWIMGAAAVGVLDTTTVGVLSPILLVFSGIVQFVAGMIALRRANGLMGTALCSFGALYTMLAIFFGLSMTGAVTATAGETALIEGFLLESFAFMAFSLMLAAIRTSIVELVVFALLGIGYALIGIPGLTGTLAGASGVIAVIGGCFLMAAAFFAYYGGLALVVNSAWKRTALPFFGQT